MTIDVLLNTGNLDEFEVIRHRDFTFLRRPVGQRLQIGRGVVRYCGIADKGNLRKFCQQRGYDMIEMREIRVPSKPKNLYPLTWKTAKKPKPETLNRPIVGGLGSSIDFIPAPNIGIMSADMVQAAIDATQARGNIISTTTP